MARRSNPGSTRVTAPTRIQPEEMTITSKPPPVPAANTSPKGSGEGRTAKSPAASAQTRTKVGQQANTKVNTTNQGYQQDRGMKMLDVYFVKNPQHDPPRQAVSVA